jgi:hypothetical protein
MDQETTRVALVYLRRIESNLDRVGEDVRDLNRRMVSLLEQLEALHVGAGDLRGGFAGQLVRLERIDARLERIERRLEERWP